MFPEKRNPLDFFKKKPDPKEMVRKWQSDMRSEQRRLERSIMNIQREEKVAQKQVQSGPDWTRLIWSLSCDICHNGFQEVTMPLLQMQQSIYLLQS